MSRRVTAVPIAKTMLNLSPLFYTEVAGESCLLDNLELKQPDKATIAAAKNDVRMALRDGIPRVFREMGLPGEVPQPRFFTQGSWAYKTLNGPAQRPQQADVDDGCYLPMSFVSKESRPEVAAEVFFRVAEAALTPLVEARDWKLSSKLTCLRVEIGPLAHIDVPLYAIPDAEFQTLAKAAALRGFALDGINALREALSWKDLPTTKVLLAHREDGWMDSDPRPVKEWFVDQVEKKGEQLRRVVRYLKAFRDWAWPTGGPSSILLMAAATPLFLKHDRRDDEALLYVAKQLAERLRQGVVNPINPAESLTDRLRGSSDEVDKVEEAAARYEWLAGQLQASMDASNADQACEWMRRVFGPRFPDEPARVKVPAAAVSAVAAAIAASPALAGPSELVGRTRAG